MTTEYTPNASAAPATITLPSDGDLRNATTLNAALEDLANFAAGQTNGHKIGGYIAVTSASHPILPLVSTVAVSNSSETYHLPSPTAAMAGFVMRLITADINTGGTAAYIYEAGGSSYITFISGTPYGEWADLLCTGTGWKPIGKGDLK